MKERLQKLIAAAGLASRRQAEEWIEAGRVTVNGRRASLGERAAPHLDRIEVDGRPLPRRQKNVTVMLNKPAGYVTTRHDPQGRPVVGELVREISERLFPVGRLDLQTEGLLILTNDGALAQRLAHPRHHVEKTYLVKARGLLQSSELEQLARGVRLEDGMTAPARVEKVRHTGSNTWFELTIHEGRNRQVRRMCEALGHPVVKLRRLRYGALELGPLPIGRYRVLSARELALLQKI